MIVHQYFNANYIYPWVIQKIKFDVFSMSLFPINIQPYLPESSHAARKLDIRSQWQLASSANILLGAHGAGLATWRNQ